MTSYTFNLPVLNHSNTMRGYLAVNNFAATQTYSSGILTLIYPIELSLDRIAVLTSLISSYSEASPITLYSYSINIPGFNSKASMNVYAVMCTFSFTPDVSVGTFLGCIQILGCFYSSSNSASSTFGIRIFDYTNNKIISELTGIGTKGIQKISMTTLSNLPSTPVILEVHALVNSPLYTLNVKGCELMYYTTS